MCSMLVLYSTNMTNRWRKRPNTTMRFCLKAFLPLRAKLRAKLVLFMWQLPLRGLLLWLARRDHKVWVHKRRCCMAWRLIICAYTGSWPLDWQGLLHGEKRHRSLTDEKRHRSLTDEKRHRSLTDEKRHRSLTDEKRLCFLSVYKKQCSLTDEKKHCFINVYKKQCSLTDEKRLCFPSVIKTMLSNRWKETLLSKRYCMTLHSCCSYTDIYIYRYKRYCMTLHSCCSYTEIAVMPTHARLAAFAKRAVTKHLHSVVVSSLHETKGTLTCVCMFVTWMHASCTLICMYVSHMICLYVFYMNVYIMNVGLCVLYVYIYIYIYIIMYMFIYIRVFI